MTKKTLMMKSADIALKDADVGIEDDGYRFSGYASVFGGVDSYGDTILAGAYAPALEQGLPKMFFNHDKFSIPIGKWLSVEEDDRGLKVVGELTKGNPQAETVAAALRHGTLDGLSVGFYPAEDGLAENDHGGFTISKIDRLLEISVVTFPADRAARIEKAEALGSIRDIEEFLRDAGLSTREAKTIVSRTKAIIDAENRRDAEAKVEAEAIAALSRIVTKLQKES